MLSSDWLLVVLLMYFSKVSVSSSTRRTILVPLSLKCFRYLNSNALDSFGPNLSLVLSSTIR